jgi:hypothetical protein
VHGKGRLTYTVAKLGAPAAVDSALDEYLVRFRNADTIVRQPAGGQTRGRWRTARGKARAYYLLRETLPPGVFDRTVARAYYGARSLTQGSPGRDRALPDFLVIGAAKCGTTSLYDWMCQHPLVMRPMTNGVPRKELLFFDYRFHRGLDWYRSHFPTAAERARLESAHGVRPQSGEATASYLTDYWVPERVRKVLPDARLIVTMRNPVDRAYSAFHMSRREGLEEFDSFETAIALEADRLAPELARTRRDRHYRPDPPPPLGYWSYLHRSRYAEHVERWLQFFDRTQFLFLEFEALAADPQATLDRVYEFLGLPRHEHSDLPKRNVGSYSSSMDPATRAQLVSYFQPHNQRLRDLTGVPFGWDH